LVGGIEIVLFDVGGVLVEVAGIDKLRQWTNPDYSDAEVWSLWLRSEAARKFERGRIDAAGFAEALARELRLPVSPEAMLEDFPGWISGVLPGARQLLESVVAGVRLGTLSNSNPVHWPRIMEEFGLASWFEVHFVSHQTGRIKPDPEAFEWALRELDCPPSRILFVDDNQVNVDAARRAGIRAHRTCGPDEARQVLSEHGLIRERNIDV